MRRAELLYLSFTFVAADALEAEQRRTVGARDGEVHASVCLLLKCTRRTPGKICTLLSLGPCEMAREGWKWDDESGLRGPATH